MAMVCTILIWVQNTRIRGYALPEKNVHRRKESKSCILVIKFESSELLVPLYLQPYYTSSN